MTIDNYLVEAYHSGRAYAEDRIRNQTHPNYNMRKYYQRIYAYDSFLKEYGKDGLDKYFGASYKRLRNHIEELTTPYYIIKH